MLSIWQIQMSWSTSQTSQQLRQQHQFGNGTLLWLRIAQRGDPLMRLLLCAPWLSRYMISFELFFLNMIVIQIHASPQHLEYFEKLQIEMGKNPPLKVPLHSNVRWTSAYVMIKRAYELRKVCIFYQNGSLFLFTDGYVGNQSLCFHCWRMLWSNDYSVARWLHTQGDQVVIFASYRSQVNNSWFYVPNLRSTWYFFLYIRVVWQLIIRTHISFNNPSLPRSSQPLGMPFLRSRISCQNGKTNSMTTNSPPSMMHYTMALRRFKSIIASSTTNQPLFSHSICLFFLHHDSFILYLYSSSFLLWARLY